MTHADPLWYWLQVLLERLRNEITRLTAVKAFASIAQSPLSLDLSPVLEPLLAELTGFLRKANRVLRQAALSAIEVTPQHAPVAYTLYQVVDSHFFHNSSSSNSSGSGSSSVFRLRLARRESA